ncbi:histidine kinase [Nonomuraea africana]|uniref:histidine kinase n=1 Tax=Nonomuraea africana TaxID=46171 RepID=A0ABR9KRI4_9ACTN|nr:histidine kinase [Nonomuraea africana]MBE1564646.1 signal transduction histidine kinase [Nonomuraea africana]
MRRDILGAVGAFAVGVVLLVGGAYYHRSGVPAWFPGVPLAITCAGVAVRRSAPLMSLALGVVALSLDVAYSGPSLPTALVFTDNLYAAALYGPARLSRWLLGITTAAAVIIGAVIGVIDRNWWALAVFGVQAALVLVVPVTTAMVLRQQRDQAIAERARAEQVAHLAELDRSAAIVAERTRMARELHDMIANHFSAIAIQSTAVLSRKDLDAAAVQQIMASIRENSVQGMAEMRTMIGLLRQEGEDGDATRPRLADAGGLVERARQAGMEMVMTIEGTPYDVPVSVDLAGYRIVQEALTNAMKHGDDRAELTITYAPGQVSVVVDNPLNGAGTQLPGAGAGLVGMRERATLVGGAFEAGPYEEKGWRVRATLPTGNEQ